MTRRLLRDDDDLTRCRLYFAQTPPPPPSQSKPVIVFVKDPMIKKISPNSDTSNSDSGRGHSSEEGDTLHRVRSVGGRDQDNAPTSSSSSPGAALTTVAKDVLLSNDADDADGWLAFSPSAKFAAFVPISFNRHRDVTGTVLLFT